MLVSYGEFKTDFTKDLAEINSKTKNITIISR